MRRESALHEGQDPLPHCEARPVLFRRGELELRDPRRGRSSFSFDVPDDEKFTENLEILRNGGWIISGPLRCHFCQRQYKPLNHRSVLLDSLPVP